MILWLNSFVLSTGKFSKSLHLRSWSYLGGDCSLPSNLDSGYGFLTGDLLSWTCFIEYDNYWSFLYLISKTLALRSNLCLIASLACTNWSNSFVSSSFWWVITLIWLLRESISTCRLELLSRRAELLYLAPSSSFLIYMIWSSLDLILASSSFMLVVSSIFLPLSWSILF